MSDTAKIRLSTRDKKLKKEFQLTPDELARDMWVDQQDYNITELMRAINKAPEGYKKILLQEELDSIHNSMAEPDLGINAMGSAKPMKITSPSALDSVKAFLTNMWSK